MLIIFLHNKSCTVITENFLQLLAIYKKKSNLKHVINIKPRERREVQEAKSFFLSSTFSWFHFFLKKYMRSTSGAWKII